MVAATPTRGVVLTTVGIAILLLAGTGGGSAGMQADERPPGATTDVDVTITPDPDQVDGVTIAVDWSTRYPARSTAEADRAQNGDLDVPWFRGDEETAAFHSAYSDSEPERPRVNVQHHASESGHGEIVVWSRTDVTLQLGTDERQLMFGPTLTESLEDGDTFGVELDHDWGPVSATTEPEPSGLHRETYSWRIGEGPDPRFEINASGVPDDPEPHGELGNGPTVAVVALALATIALATKRRR